MGTNACYSLFSDFLMQGQQIKATRQENQLATGTGISPEVMSMVTSIQASLRQVTERISQMEAASQPKTQESADF